MHARDWHVIWAVNTFQWKCQNKRNWSDTNNLQANFSATTNYFLIRYVCEIKLKFAEKMTPKRRNWIYHETVFVVTFVCWCGIWQHSSWTGLSNFNNLLSVSQQIFDIEFPEAFYPKHKILPNCVGFSEFSKIRKQIELNKPRSTNESFQMKLQHGAIYLKLWIILLWDPSIIFNRKLHSIFFENSWKKQQQEEEEVDQQSYSVYGLYGK